MRRRLFQPVLVFVVDANEFVRIDAAQSLTGQQAVDAGSTKELAQAENMLTGALRQLFALSEAYPDLKANTNFLSLQNELADLENKIAAARRFFNNAVAEYNTAIEQFPAVVLANAFGFKPDEFFEVAASERAKVEAAPNVKF